MVKDRGAKDWKYIIGLVHMAVKSAHQWLVHTLPMQRFQQEPRKSLLVGSVVLVAPTLIVIWLLFASKAPAFMLPLVVHEPSQWKSQQEKTTSTTTWGHTLVISPFIIALPELVHPAAASMSPAVTCAWPEIYRAYLNIYWTSMATIQTTSIGEVAVSTGETIWFLRMTQAGRRSLSMRSHWKRWIGTYRLRWTMSLTTLALTSHRTSRALHVPPSIKIGQRKEKRIKNSHSLWARETLLRLSASSKKLSVLTQSIELFILKTLMRWKTHNWGEVWDKHYRTLSHRVMSFLTRVGAQGTVVCKDLVPLFLMIRLSRQVVDSQSILTTNCSLSDLCLAVRTASLIIRIEALVTLAWVSRANQLRTLPWPKTIASSDIASRCYSSIKTMTWKQWAKVRDQTILVSNNKKG